MHRSGTSAMARVLSLAGGALPERVIQPGPDNPLGFWEPWEMVALNDEILADIGSSWDDILVHVADTAAWERRDAFLGRAEAFVTNNFGDRPLPVIKDPRASVLTRLWRQALVTGGYRPVYVIMVRHPVEVAGSLAARDGFPTAKSLLVWAAYMLAAERDTRDEARVFVAYPDLIADWRAVLDRIQTVVGNALPGRDDAAAAEIDRYLSRSHRHHEASDQPLSGPDVLPVVAAVHDWMQAAAAGRSPDPGIMDEAAGSLDQLAATLAPIQAYERRYTAAREASLQSGLADAEARLLRARGHAIELELGLAEQDARTVARARVLEASLAVETTRAATARAEAASRQAELRAAHLSLTGLQTELAEARRMASDIRSTLAAVQTEAADRLQAVQARDIRIGTLEHDLEAGLRRIQQLDADHVEWRARAESLAARIDTIKRSLAWKVARPIRVIEGRLKRRGAPAS